LIQVRKHFFFLSSVGVHGVVSRKSVVIIKRINASSGHVVSVGQPNIVSFLSSESSKSNTNNNRSNDNYSQKSTSNSVWNIRWKRHEYALVVSIADTTSINSGSWDLLQVASKRGITAKSFIAGTNKMLDSGNGQTVHRGEETSTKTRTVV